MEAVFIRGVRDVVLGDHPEPRPADDQMLIEVAAIGICGSDLHYYLEGAIGDQQVEQGFVPGHEFAGRIIDPRAEAFGFSIGDLVAVDPANPCGDCEWCHRGHHNLCPRTVMTGAPPHSGAMTRYITARPANLFPVPEGFDATTAAMLEPLGVAIHAVDLARPKLWESCCVVGAGSIGLLLTQVARRAGVGEIYVVEPVAERRRLAAQFGGDHLLADIEELDEITNGRGADLVLEATDQSGGLELAARAARIGGRCVVGGIPEGNRYQLDAALVRRKGLSVKFSRRMGDVYPRAIAMVHKGLVDVGTIASHHFSLDQAAEAFERQAERSDGVVKSILHPHDGD
ncbi:MAG: zinc-binding dehydrogenase [Geminicoccaceae bacterium]